MKCDDCGAPVSSSFDYCPECGDYQKQPRSLSKLGIIPGMDNSGNVTSPMSLMISSIPIIVVGLLFLSVVVGMTPVPPEETGQNDEPADNGQSTEPADDGTGGSEENRDNTDTTGEANEETTGEGNQEPTSKEGGEQVTGEEEQEPTQEEKNEEAIPFERPNTVPAYEVVDIEDVSYPLAERRVINIRPEEDTSNLESSDIEAISKDAVHQVITGEDVNAVSVDFYNGGTIGAADIVVEWAPNGDWGQASSVETGNYSQHEFHYP